jgi:hypothetical protein
MKKYTISYSHIGGERDKTTTDPEKLLTWLEEALQDEYVSRSSIKIETEEKK